MIQEIINGILAALYEEFGEEYTLYTESVEQGLKEPCFFVFCVNVETKLVRGRRYQHTGQFVIQYLTGSKEPRAEFAEVAERLYACLEMITASDGILRGNLGEAEITGEALTLFANYDFFSYRPGIEQKMEALEGTETSLKG